MSETEIMGEQYKQTRDYFTQKIDDSDLCTLLESTTPAKIADESFIEGLKTAYPNYKSELLTFHQEVKDMQDDGEEAYNWTEYFEETSNGGKKFQSKWLADDIEEDYTFKKIKDSEELYVFKNGYYQPKGHQVIREESEKRLDQEYKERRVKEVISRIEARNYIKRKRFRPPKRKINLKNGVYDLEKEELVQHSPEYYFTHKVQTRWDPTQDCPNINEFLEDIVRSEEEVKTLREIAGYLLLPDYPIPKASILLGKGNNGKSRYLDLLRNLIGDENLVEKGLQDLEGRFGTHELQGKLGCIDDDLSSRKINEETSGTMKKLTGGSKVGAEVKYGGSYSFYNYAKLVFACNELPRTSDDTDGFYRRWVLVEFPYKFVENPNPENNLEKQGKPKKQLIDEITDKNELEGFLWWAVQSLQDVLNNDEFTHSLSTEETREKWKEYSIPLVKFIQTYVEQGTTRTEAEKKSEEDNSIKSYQFDYVRKDYLQEVIGDYCEAHSHSRPSKKAITKELEKHFYVGTKSRTAREPEDKQVPVYSGIKVSHPDPEEVAGLQGYSETIASACADGRVESSNQSVQPCNDEFESVSSRVLEFLQESESTDGVEVEDVLEEIEEPRDEIESAIDQLKHDGEVYDTQAGRIDCL